MISRFIVIVEGLSKGTALLSALALACLAALTLAEIGARALFGMSLMVTTEYGGYLLLAAVSLGFGLTLRDGALIRITMIRRLLPPAARKGMDVFACAGGLAVSIFILWHSARMVADHKRLDILADSMAETPLWIPQLLVPIGFSLFALQLLATAARLLTRDEEQ
ncbi:Tripartite ATP-independent periplasmic transporter DctQ component [Alkalidesulfovibrio alkalitolerans DSM 16529]|jgi:TRAP-type C4-dicarboxylate transport system permease small subunit|uniref:Tripartite ATP-independent periplasmic transporter DctQ component n=1 Tax=Alkalidesulfovibrio alkalitolerans DSM 16529 TaxID=1121439 RepID=S7UG53_9BACT|nr:TRAP transporter small permease [Alkalidesulfovibrio alkalitolerans]EPR32754.1 Tripartite ATP-independent periplasmic transporter DctQ component [Alkalidesulfovibrio alkalitolerans DSM 16529]